ncbi:MAG: aldo/keto reductase [Chloroflexota bacterium]|jgi:predicted oxidoreductase
MKRIRLTEDGATLSQIVAGVMRLGEWGLEGEGLRNFISQCLDMGVTTFDHADIYGSYSCEGVFGEALAAEPGLRSRMELVTKCGIQLQSPNRPDTRIHHYNTSREHIIASAENSLRQLRTDYLDVLLIHRPDPLMDADEVAEALTHLHAMGKIRHAGVSNFMPWQFHLLQSRLDLPLVTNQIELSVLYLDPLHDGTLDQMQRLCVPAMAWSPIGGGQLFGDEERARRIRGTLEQIGRELGGASIDQVALSWLMRHPVPVLPVLGTGKLERIEAAVAATKLTLDRQQWFAVWESSTGHEVP